MTKVIKLVKKIYHYIKMRIYVNEKIILFQHQKHTNQKSPATIVEANKDNVKDILAFQDKRYLKVFNHFLEIGDKGYFAYLNGKCVHRSWVKHKPQYVSLHSLLSIPLNYNEVFIHYCETAPDARGKNIYPHVLSRIASDFKDRSRILISVNEKNISSIKGVKKAGFVEIEHYRLIVIFGIKYIRVEKLY